MRGRGRESASLGCLPTFPHKQHPRPEARVARRQADEHTVWTCLLEAGAVGTYEKGTTQPTPPIVSRRSIENHGWRDSGIGPYYTLRRLPQPSRTPAAAWGRCSSTIPDTLMLGNRGTLMITRGIQSLMRGKRKGECRCTRMARFEDGSKNIQFRKKMLSLQGGQASHSIGLGPGGGKRRRHWELTVSQPQLVWSCAGNRCLSWKRGEVNKT